MKNLRNNKKRGVTPVIATILLISSTLVLALALGAYTFGLFGSNVHSITLVSAVLYSGDEAAVIGVPAESSSYILFSLNNPGPITEITGLPLTGAGIITATAWEMANGSYVGFAAGVPSQYNNLNAGTVTTFSYYPFGVAQPILSGQIYGYTIEFANGQSISGSLVAQ